MPRRKKGEPVVDADYIQTDRSAEINVWKPKKGEIICESDGNNFIINFDKVFKNPEFVKLNNFCVKKASYEEHLKTYSQYINYFINKYDPEDELVTGYLHIKYQLDILKQPDGEDYFNRSNPMALKECIYETIFTDTMVEKINRMVDENYLDDIERPAEESTYTGNKEYLESLEFKNEHIKMLLAISFGMKIMIPIIYHYFTKNRIKPDELTSKRDVSIVYDFFKDLLPMFSGEVNMFNKLFVYVKRKVVDANFHNEKIFLQREIFGDDQAVLIEKFVKKQLISENIAKYKFNRKWDPKKKRYLENPIGLNKTIIRFQIIFFLKETYPKNLTEMTNNRDSEGLSASDKMEMNLTKIDKGIIDLSNINIRDTLRRMSMNHDIPITDEELDYYRKHRKPNDMVTQLTRSQFAKEFMSYRDQYIVPGKDVLKMLLLLKKNLIFQAGYRDGKEHSEAVVLPYILTGNISGKVNNRIIRNSKMLARIEENPDYQDLVTKKYKEIEELYPGYIKEIISKFLYTKFTYVSYEHPELTGQEIQVDDDQLCNELIQYLKAV